MDRNVIHMVATLSFVAGMAFHAVLQAMGLI